MSSDDSNERYIRLKDGTLINVETGQRILETRVNKNFSDISTVAPTATPAKTQSSYDGGRRRFIDELPVPAPQSKAIAIIAGYAIFGLHVNDIAFIINEDVERVQAVIDTEEYTKFLDCMLANIREHDQDKVRKRINDAAEDAAKKITQLVSDPDPKVALSASKDVLDRASDGAYSAGGGQNKSAGLTIRVVRDADHATDKVEVELT